MGEIYKNYEFESLVKNIYLQESTDHKLLMNERNDTIVSIQEKWETLNKTEKIFVLEFVKGINPHRKKELESVINRINKNVLHEKWYNTVLDLVGWVDPTGIADAINGVIYFGQGDYLFGFLSMVGAVPYVGDVVAKPVKYALSAGKPSAKALNKVMALSKAGKSAEASKALAELSARPGLISTFIKGFSKLADKLEELIKNIPAGPLKGFKNTILEWISLFKNYAKTGTKLQSRSAGLARVLPKLGKADQLKQLKRLQDTLKAEKGLFTGYRTGNKLFSWKTFWGGMPQLMGRNRSVRALMRKTKWYLGLLDFLGMGDFVGPDELASKMGEADFEKKITEYNNTPEARQNFEDEFGSEQDAENFLNQQETGSETTPSTSQGGSSVTQSATQQDPILALLGF
jgi:hypothetical protein